MFSSNRITADIKLLDKVVINNTKGLRILLLTLNGINVIPTKLTLTNKVRRRGNKLYGQCGVYTIV